MSIRARIHPSGAITVHEKPNWLLRLFGCGLKDYEADWSGAWWVNADTGAMVSAKAAEAIERAVTKRAVERRLIERMVRR